MARKRAAVVPRVTTTASCSSSPTLRIDLRRATSISCYHDRTTRALLVLACILSYYENSHENSIILTWHHGLIHVNNGQSFASNYLVVLGAVGDFVSSSERDRIKMAVQSR